MKEDTPEQQEEQTTTEQRKEESVLPGSWFSGLRNLQEKEDYMECLLIAFPATTVWILAKLLLPIAVFFCFITLMETVMMGIAFILVIFGLLLMLAWLNRKTLRIDRQQVIFDGREFEREAVHGFRTFDVETTLFASRFGPAVKGAKIGFDYGDGFVRYSGYYAPSEAEKVVNLLNNYLKKIFVKKLRTHG